RRSHVAEPFANPVVWRIVSVAAIAQTSLALLPQSTWKVCFTPVGVGLKDVPSQWTIVPPEPPAQTSSLPDPQTAVGVWSTLTPVSPGHKSAASHVMICVTQLGSDASQPPSGDDGPSLPASLGGGTTDESAKDATSPLSTVAQLAR